MAEREVYVELPPERARDGYCCRLRRCLYGTRDAPRLWEEFAASALAKLGFLRGKASAVCFYHPGRKLRCLVHGDDFLFAGHKQDLLWARAGLEKDILLSCKGILGPKPDEVREFTCLGRILRWTAGGYELEADPRHAEILQAYLGHHPRSVVTPGVKEKATRPRGAVRSSEQDEGATEFDARVSIKSAKVSDLHQQIRDLAAQLDKQQASNRILEKALAGSVSEDVSSSRVLEPTHKKLAPVTWGSTQVRPYAVQPGSRVRPHERWADTQKVGRSRARARDNALRREAAAWPASLSIGLDADESDALVAAFDRSPPGRADPPSARWRASLVEAGLVLAEKRLARALTEAGTSPEEIAVVVKNLRLSALPLGTETSADKANGLSTLAAVRTVLSREEEEEEESSADRVLSEEECSLFRAAAARSNYLALDRIDIVFAAKELCRRMAVPRQIDLVALRRLASYLVGTPRVVQRYPGSSLKG